MAIFGKGEGGVSRLAQTLNATDVSVLSGHAQQLVTDTLADVIATNGVAQTVDIRTRGVNPVEHKDVRVISSPRPIRVGDTVRFHRGSGGLRFCESWDSLTEALSRVGFVGRIAVFPPTQTATGDSNDDKKRTAIVRLPSPAGTNENRHVFLFDSIREDAQEGDNLVVLRLPTALVHADAEDTEDLQIAYTATPQAQFFGVQILEEGWKYDDPRLIEDIQLDSTTLWIQNPLINARFSELLGWTPVLMSRDLTADDIREDRVPNRISNRSYGVAILVSSINEPAIPTATYGFHLNTIDSVDVLVTWYPESDDPIADATSGVGVASGGINYRRAVSEMYRRMPTVGEHYLWATIRLRYPLVRSIDGETLFIHLEQYHHLYFRRQVGWLNA